MENLNAEDVVVKAGKVVINAEVEDVIAQQQAIVDEETIKINNWEGMIQARQDAVIADEACITASQEKITIAQAVIDKLS